MSAQKVQPAETQAAHEDLGDLRAYREKLRSYSTEELEDIYHHIHILRQPLRYRLLVNELEARRVRPTASSHVDVSALDMGAWLASKPALARLPLLRGLLLAALLFVCTGALTFLLLAPIWLFAMPLHFLGLQTAIVYFACAPVPPIVAGAIGGKLGGRGMYGVWALLGVAAGMAAFYATGAPAAIIRSVVEAHGAGGGMSFGGFG